jgi:hypothetical protein
MPTRALDLDAMSQRNLEILDRLAESGLQVARSIEERAKTAKSREELGELKRSYDLVVHGVLQTLHLRSKLAVGEIPSQVDAPLREIVETMAGILRPPGTRSLQ